MDDISRRNACRTAVVVLTGISVAGCTSDSPDEGRSPGGPVTVDGVDIVYTDYTLAESLRPVGRTQTATGGDTSTDSNPQTPITPVEEQSFLGVAFRMTNSADGSRRVPMPRPAPVMSKGEIHLLFDVAAHRRKNPSSIGVGPTVETDDGTVDSLTHTLGQFQSELPAGEEVTGWAFYPIPRDVAVQDIRVVIADLDLSGKTVEWQVTDA
jgi:hypothetical protein